MSQNRPWRRVAVVIFAFAAALFGFSDAARAQSRPETIHTIYIIGNINGLTATYPLPIFGAAGQTAFFSHLISPEDRGGGAVGLAVDEVNEQLFVTYEFTGVIDVVDARTAELIAKVPLAGTSDLAGIDVLKEREELYVVDRLKSTVYVFNTGTYARVESWIMRGNEGAFGIDAVAGVDGRDVLFATDGSETVRWYDLDTHDLAGEAELPDGALAIDVDNSGIGPSIYTVSILPPGHEEEETNPAPLKAYPAENSSYITRYDVGSGEARQGSIAGGGGTGISLNARERVAYVTHTVGGGGGNLASLRLYDMDTLALIRMYDLDFCTGVFRSCSPTDIQATGLSFGTRLEKELTSHPEGLIEPGDEVVFTITITNESTYTMTSASMTDLYLFNHLTFTGADPAPDDTLDDGALNWSNIIDAAGGPLMTGESHEIEIRFTAQEVICLGAMTGANTARVEDVQTEEHTPLPGAEDEASYALTCIPPDEEDDDTDLDLGDDDTGGAEFPPPDEGTGEGEVTGGCCGCSF
ncbi:MAG: hypothetical protein M5R36_01275 [Deltaproteobacteria bacterium]|nr:hypothetical protein [Deltaproteobacteria bacterium]